MKRMARTTAVLVAALALGAVSGLELAYRLAIASIVPPPSLDAGPALSPRLTCAIWAAATGGGPRPIPRLYPWAVHRYVARHDLAFTPAWGVARKWLAAARERGQVGGMLQWHLKGIAATAWVTRNLPQQEIMRRYADTFSAGEPESGLEAGARYWYQAAATSLDDAQLALLFAIADSPNTYDPIRHPERALERRNYILGRFLRGGCIRESSLAAAQAAPLSVRTPTFREGAPPNHQQDFRGRERAGACTISWPAAEAQEMRTMFPAEPLPFHALHELAQAQAVLDSP